jgi:hypothetical protein
MTIPSSSNEAAEYVGGKAFQGAEDAPSKASVNKSNIDIIDIRHDAVEINLKEEILDSLRPKAGPKKLPTLLLYDERGLQLFEEVSVPIMVMQLYGMLTKCIDHVFRRILSHQRGDQCSRTIR